MATLRSTTWRERAVSPSSPEYSIDGVRSKGVRTIDVAYRQSYPNCIAQAARDFLGYSKLNEGGQFINRIVPWQDPTFGWLYANSIGRISGVGNKRNANTDIFEDREPDFPVPDVGDLYGTLGGNVHRVANYEYFRFTINFNALTYEIVSDDNVRDESSLKRYVTKSLRPGGSHITLPANSLFYVVRPNDAFGNPPLPGDAYQPIAFGMTKNLPQYNVSYTWHQIPAKAVPTGMSLLPGIVPENPANPAIEKSLGLVNLTAFDGFDAGTMLLVAVELAPDRQADGQRVFNVTYNFSWRPTPPGQPTTQAIGSWNSLIMLDGYNKLIWSEVVAGRAANVQTRPLANDNYHLYPAIEMKNLFRPATWVA